VVEDKLLKARMYFEQELVCTSKHDRGCSAIGVKTQSATGGGLREKNTSERIHKKRTESREELNRGEERRHDYKQSRRTKMAFRTPVGFVVDEKTVREEGMKLKEMTTPTVAWRWPNAIRLGGRPVTGIQQSCPIVLSHTITLRYVGDAPLIATVISRLRGPPEDDIHLVSTAGCSSKSQT
jgi:hypothetical protein